MHYIFKKIPLLRKLRLIIIDLYLLIIERNKYKNTVLDLKFLKEFFNNKYRLEIGGSSWIWKSDIFVYRLEKIDNFNILKIQFLIKKVQKVKII